MATQFSFDITSSYDVAEMNNTITQAQREISNRYDFKGTNAELDWTDGDKKSLKICGDNDYHIEAILDIVRKKAAGRGISQKTFDVSQPITTANLKNTKQVPFVESLDSEKTKKITKIIRDKLPKVKTQIQGDEVRVTSSKKDELQTAMQALKEADFDFPINFVNFR